MTDIKELLKALRSKGEGCKCFAYYSGECCCDAVCGENYTQEAADVIELLLAEKAKLRQEVELPKPFCHTDARIGKYELERVALYGVRELQQYGDASDQAGYLRGLDEAKQACLQKHANGNWKHDTREECADAIEELKGGAEP